MRDETANRGRQVGAGEAEAQIEQAFYLAAL
jgi:hypothetical protein